MKLFDLGKQYRNRSYPQLYLVLISRFIQRKNIYWVIGDQSLQLWLKIQNFC